VVRGSRPALFVALGHTLTSRVHGMAQDLTGPDWPALSVGKLTPVLALFPGLGEVRDVAWHSARPFAASGIVSCARQQVFVKRHDPRVRSVRDLLEEHAFIAHLQARGAVVPAILSTRQRETAVATPDGTYEVQALADGDDIFRDAHPWTPLRSAAEARATGQALARLHDAADGYSAPKRQTRLVAAGDAVIRSADPIAAVTRWAAEDPLLETALAGRAWRKDFGRVICPWHEALRPFWSAMPPAWVHGDFHVSNLLWRNGGVSSVLDFGLCNRASALFDLATAIERNAIEWLRLTVETTDIGRTDLACALVEAYTGARALPDAELHALRHLLPVVHVDFALSELAYFNGITSSQHNADVAYTQFLLGHAAWFAGPNGARFLSSLE
jgi:Ser/Thr protein kinase RdoA (MazF antagonist)